MGDLRVLHVINKMSPSGGAEVSLAQTIPLLSAHGVHQGVVTLLPSTAHAVMAGLRALGIRLYDTGGDAVPTSVRGVVAAIGDFRPHLVSSSLYEANRAARLAGALTATPVLCALVGTPYDAEARRAATAGWKLAGVARLEGLMARHLTSHFHALTVAATDSAVRHLGIDRGATTVLARGRDRRTLGHPGPGRRTAARRALAVPDSAFVVLNVGRQERAKGQTLLIDAFDRLASREPRAVLLVAGRRGAASVQLERRVTASPFADRIRLLGLRDDVADLLSAADVFAFSSLWEGLGGAVLEAMAMQTPVVSFDVPAVVEVLGGTGVTVPLGDAAALGEALLQLADDAALRHSLAAAGRARFDQHYELGRIVPALEALYRHAAMQPPPGRRRRPRVRA